MLGEDRNEDDEILSSQYACGDSDLILDYTVLYKCARTTCSKAIKIRDF